MGRRTLKGTSFRVVGGSLRASGNPDGYARNLLKQFLKSIKVWFWHKNDIKNNYFVMRFYK